MRGWRVTYTHTIHSTDKLLIFCLAEANDSNSVSVFLGREDECEDNVMGGKDIKDRDGHRHFKIFGSSRHHSPSSLTQQYPPPKPPLLVRMASSLKTLLACSALAFVSVRALPSHNVARQEAVPTVTVKNGTYEGLYSPEYDQDFFLGMRYAEVSLAVWPVWPLTIPSSSSSC